MDNKWNIKGYGLVLKNEDMAALFDFKGYMKINETYNSEEVEELRKDFMAENEFTAEDFKEKEIFLDYQKCMFDEFEVQEVLYDIENYAVGTFINTGYDENTNTAYFFFPDFREIELPDTLIPMGENVSRKVSDITLSGIQSHIFETMKPYLLDGITKEILTSKMQKINTSVDLLDNTYFDEEE